MAYKPKFSDLAADDLDEIIRYFCDDLYMPQAAGRFHKSIYKQLDLICNNPCMYPLHHDDKLRNAGLRFVTVGKYVLFYTVDDYATVVNIVRIVYGSRNFSIIFED